MVKVKVTMSLTLLSFKKTSLVKCACQIWKLSLLHSKVIVKVIVDNRQTRSWTPQVEQSPEVPLPWTIVVRVFINTINKVKIQEKNTDVSKCLRNKDAPGGNKVKIIKAKISKVLHFDPAQHPGTVDIL